MVHIVTEYILSKYLTDGWPKSSLIGANYSLIIKTTETRGELTELDWGHWQDDHELEALENGETFCCSKEARRETMGGQDSSLRSSELMGLLD